jgi:hypothetical protein
MGHVYLDFLSDVCFTICNASLLMYWTDVDIIFYASGYKYESRKVSPKSPTASALDFTWNFSEK